MKTLTTQVFFIYEQNKNVLLNITIQSFYRDVMCLHLSLLKTPVLCFTVIKITVQCTNE